MNKPHWEKKHDWWVEDFKFELYLRWEFKKMLRRHPDDNLGDIFRQLVKICDRNIQELKKSYKKIYGGNFNLRKIIKEVEVD